MNKIPLLFVSVDALGRKMTKEAKTPFIDYIKKNGNNVENATSCFPTLTTPMMSTILTGCYPEKHGINCNSKFRKDIQKIEGKLRDLKTETISDILRTEGYRTLSVQHFMIEGRVDKYLQIDGSKSELNTKTIIQSLQKNKFDAVFTIYQAVDYFGHKTGPFSKKTISEIEKVDHELEKLVSFLNEYWEDFLFVLTSDHSMSLAYKSTKFDLKAKLKNIGLKGKYYNVGQDVEKSTDCVLLKYPTVSIFLNSEKAKQSEREILKMLKSEKDIEKVYSKQEMHNLGNGEYADIAYYLKEGFSHFPSILHKFKKFGYHGTENESDSTICYWGNGVDNYNIQNSNLTDIVPSCLDYLELNFKKERFDGKSTRR
ncbi:MAG: hypothetical protein PWQ77_2147 [Kosmotogales bacterium]|nr:hypothetical protein [Kosmotogales bacterium]